MYEDLQWRGRTNKTSKMERSAKQSKRFIFDLLSVPAISTHAKDINVYKYQKNNNQLKNINVYQILVRIQIHSSYKVQSL